MPLCFFDGMVDCDLYVSHRRSILYGNWGTLVEVSSSEIERMESAGGYVGGGEWMYVFLYIHVNNLSLSPTCAGNRYHRATLYSVCRGACNV
jgi:hypothetical protein